MSAVIKEFIAFTERLYTDNGDIEMPRAKMLTDAFKISVEAIESIREKRDGMMSHVAQNIIDEIERIVQRKNEDVK